MSQDECQFYKMSCMLKRMLFLVLLFFFLCNNKAFISAMVFKVKIVLSAELINEMTVSNLFFVVVVA